MWDEAQQALIDHLKFAFPQLTWNSELIGLTGNGERKLAVFYQGMADVGGRLELFGENVGLWDNGKFFKAVSFWEPDSIHIIEAFIKRERPLRWSYEAQQS